MLPCDAPASELLLIRKHSKLSPITPSYRCPGFDKFLGKGTWLGTFLPMECTLQMRAFGISFFVTFSAILWLSHD